MIWAGAFIRRSGQGAFVAASNSSPQLAFLVTALQGIGPKMAGHQTELPIQPPSFLRVLDDYGYVGSGVSQAHSILAENGEEYLAKGPSLVEGHPYVAANEYMAARLAQALGLPILDFRIVLFDDEPLFASSWMNEDTFHLQTTEELFNRCENRDRVYDLVVFDAWIANWDRHVGNLLVREIRPRGGAQSRFLLLLNDHSHCLVAPGQTGFALGFNLLAPPWQSVQHVSYVRDAITDSARLASALSRASAIPDGTIDTALAEMPARFLPSRHEATQMRNYLLERRDCLTEIFRIHRATFEKLDGGPL